MTHQRYDDEEFVEEEFDNAEFVGCCITPGSMDACRASCVSASTFVRSSPVAIFSKPTYNFSSNGSMP
jgi:hypothetical protein